MNFEVYRNSILHNKADRMDRDFQAANASLASDIHESQNDESQNDESQNDRTSNEDFADQVVRKVFETYSGSKGFLQ